ncbi:MAG: ABC transporter permease [Chloroflexi bacterium]|nr:ABC transporter permease [Chloroflexota bacterium]
MLRYLSVRLGHSGLVLVMLSVVTFTLLHLAPGGPAILMGTDISPDEAARMRANLGLDQPLYVQYAKWASAMLQGNFGRSFTDGRPVTELVAQRLPNTLLLSGSALMLALVFGVSGGVAAALVRGSALDRLVMLFAVIGESVPVFWLAILTILLFAVQLHVLPSSGMRTLSSNESVWDLLQHLILPSLVLSTLPMAQLARYSRSGLIGVLGQDFVRTARAKGLPERLVLFRHALRSALIPLVTVVGLALPVLVSGAAITETIFGWPGMGRLAVDAALRRDYPLVMGVTITVAAAVIVINLAIDVVYLYLDPRVKLG